MAKVSKGKQLQQESMGAMSLANPLGRVWFVDSVNGANGNDGTSRIHSVATLAYAVTSLAEAGDTILLAPGGAETLTATISVTQAGLRIICPVVNPQQGYELTGAGTVDLLTVSGADVHLEGLRFTRSAGAGSTTAGLLTTAAADRLTVYRCAFDYSALTSSFTNYGIEFTDGIDDVLVKDCLFLDCHRSVLFATATATTLDRCTIQGNTFYVGQSTAWGIYSEPAGTGLIQGIQILDNVFVEADGDGSVATDPWDGTTGSDGASGPIWLDADVDQSSVIAGNRAYTASVVGSFEGLCAIDSGALVRFDGNLPAAGVLTGEADIDIDQADYTSYQALLTLTPLRGALEDVDVVFDLAKATTGFAAGHTTETITLAVQRKVDGTNWRTVFGSETTAVTGTAAAAGAEKLSIGRVGETEEARVVVKLSAENAVDVELPYVLTFKGAPPTVTAVAAA